MLSAIRANFKILERHKFPRGPAEEHKAPNETTFHFYFEAVPLDLT